MGAATGPGASSVVAHGFVTEVEFGSEEPSVTLALVSVRVWSPADSNSSAEGIPDCEAASDGSTMTLLSWSSIITGLHAPAKAGAVAESESLFPE